MNKEEKEAIERLNRKLTIEKFTKNIGMPVYIKDVELVLNLIQKQEKEIDQLNQVLNDRVDVKQTADSISFTMPSKVAEASMKVLEESALTIENKRLSKLLEKQDKIINAMKYRVVLTEKEHRMILKMLERRSNKRYEDCVVEYFKKEVEEDGDREKH
jgi:hypothetical protein